MSDAMWDGLFKALIAAFTLYMAYKTHTFTTTQKAANDKMDAAAQEVAKVAIKAEVAADKVEKVAEKTESQHKEIKTGMDENHKLMNSRFDEFRKLIEAKAFQDGVNSQTSKGTKDNKRATDELLKSIDDNTKAIDANTRPPDGAK